MVPHTVCHFEWYSTDLARTEQFLAGLFGWEFKPLGDDYLLFDLADGPDGGIIKVDKVEAGKSPIIYIEVPAIEPYLVKAEELGGAIKTSKSEFPALGWYAHLSDPDGNVIGIFQELDEEEYEYENETEEYEGDDETEDYDDDEETEEYEGENETEEYEGENETEEYEGDDETEEYEGENETEEYEGDEETEEYEGEDEDEEEEPEEFEE